MWIKMISVDENNDEVRVLRCVMKKVIDVNDKCKWSVIR